MKFNKKKIAFFDRDGVLNISNINDGYIGFKKDFKWVTGAKKALKYIQNLGYKIIIVTNQSGVARGYFSIKDVNILHKYMRASLKKIDVRISGIFFCPFHIDGVVSKYKKKSNLRKPGNKMIKNIFDKFLIDKRNSFMIGDKNTDKKCAKKSKLKFFYAENNFSNQIKKIIRKI